MDDRGRCRTERRESIDHRFEIIDVGNDDLHDVAILTRDAVALQDFRSALCCRFDLLQLPHHRPDPQNRGDRIACGLRIDRRVVPPNYSGLFETAQAVTRRGGRKSDAARELAASEASVLL